MSRQILDIHMGLVYNFSELLAINDFLIHIHGNPVIKVVGLGSIAPYNFCYG